MNFKKMYAWGKSNMLWVFSIFFFLVVLFSFLSLERQFEHYHHKDKLQYNIFLNNQRENFDFRKKILLSDLELKKEEGCILLEVVDSVLCDIKKDEWESCFKEVLPVRTPRCLAYDVFHMKKPDQIRAVYLSSYGASRNDKVQKLLKWARSTEVNAVVLDVKEINGEVYFTIPTEGFRKIQPEFDIIIRNPKMLIEKFHAEGIYIIARVVLFKDGNLALRRPDLAVKKADKETVWKDYRGKMWVDPGSEEVWKYNLEIARQVYMMGFDEINLDYVRFPSDGPMDDIFFPFSQEDLDADKQWGRARVMDRFYHYFTETLRTEFPEIKISASIFGQVALNYNDVSIGQILSSAMLYFDDVAPMAYPSHYHRDFGNFADGPDNHPYDVIDLTLEKGNIKIDKLNREIREAQEENRAIQIREGFYASVDPSKVQKVEYDQMRLWLQAFTCTWCVNSMRYTGTEVQAQAQAVYDNKGDSWMLWNASSNYNDQYFKPN